MKKFLACVLLSSVAVAHANDIEHPFIFPPFAKEDVAVSEHPFPRYPSYEELQSMSAQELRGAIGSGDSSGRRTATKELLERGDQKTILRLVYSLKQGNVEAMGLLSDSTLAVVPYLMEDVAHGSFNYYGGYILGDGGYSDGRVREAVVERVSSVLFRATEFTGGTRECLRAIGRGNGDRVQTLSEKSRYLVQWWLLNKDAFEAGKWDETLPLPYEITYPDPKEDKIIPPDEGWDPERQPPFGSPLWELDESFEAWAARIVDPNRRNLDFVALSWDGKKVVEHPAKSLDPKARPEDRESRKTPAPRNPPDVESGESIGGRKGLIGITAAAVLLAGFSIIRWLRIKRED